MILLPDARYWSLRNVFWKVFFLMEQHVEQQALIVHLRLSDDAFGTDADHAAIWELEEQIEQAVEATSVGDLDGDEFGQGECVLFIYGPDADRLFSVVEPLLRSCPIASGGFAIKQYGDISDLDLETARVTW
jgi:hypothetical protein